MPADTVSNITSGFNRKITMDSIKTDKTSVNTTNKQQKVSVTTVKVSESFNCSIEQLYEIFVKEELSNAFTRSQCKVEPITGGM